MGLTAITSHDIELLLSNKALTNNIIDAFSSLLEEEVKSSDDKDLPDTKYLLSHAWNAVEDLEAVAMHSLIFEPLYDYVRSAHLIIIPLRHTRKHHFTLLTFDTMAPCFFHYDSMSARQSRPGECLKEAESMVNMINFWMRGVLFQADEMLRTGERKKLNKRESNNSFMKLDMDYLTEKEILSIKWVQENFNSYLKLVDQNDVVPKQALGSLDCGVYVMHYMDFLANEKKLCCEFDVNDVIRFRADIVNRFARSSRCWRAAQ